MLRSLALVSMGLISACTGSVGDPASREPGAPPPGPIAPESCDEPYPIASDMRRLGARQYARAIEVVFDGRIAPSTRFPDVSRGGPTGYSTEGGFSDVSEQAVEEIAYAAEDVALEVADAIADLVPCDDRACAERFLDVYGRRAYRRPLDDAERATLLATFDATIADGGTFAESIALLVAHMLQTPQFLYAVEDAAPDGRALGGLEIATRLSLLFTDSIPDDALLDAAIAGELDTRDGIVAHATMLLDSERADTSIARFLREWTGTLQVSRADKSAELFPEFDADYARSMNESFDRFAVRELRAGSLDSLFRSRTVAIDPIMAAHFGVAAPSAWAEVELGAFQSGILTQPALLASLAHSDSPSYVFRGKVVRTRLLCQPLGAPPADAMSRVEELRSELPADPTARQESEAVRGNATCAVCHDLLDPAGLALERFDAIGRYREEDELGRSIDPSGTLAGTSAGDVAFADHVQMIDAIASDPQLDACYARQVFRFAMSRLETPADACAVAQIEDALAETGELRAALVAMAASDAFRFRVAP
jgi:hypothetical protein